MNPMRETTTGRWLDAWAAVRTELPVLFRGQPQLCDGIHPHFNVSPLGSLGDVGDLLLPNTSLPAMREALAPLAAQLIRQHHMAWIGGDHSITLPLLRAYKAWLKRPLAVIHFDAHCDTWDSHFGEPSGHGTWVYEAMQEGLVIDACFTQIGIRSAGQREARDHVQARGGQIFTARALRGLHSPAQQSPALSRLTKLGPRFVRALGPGWCEPFRSSP